MLTVLVTIILIERCFFKIKIDIILLKIDSYVIFNLKNFKNRLNSFFIFFENK